MQTKAQIIRLSDISGGKIPCKYSIVCNISQWFFILPQSLWNTPKIISQKIGAMRINAWPGASPPYRMEGPSWMCQMVLLYWRIVRSELKKPDLAVLTMAMRNHLSRFW